MHVYVYIYIHMVHTYLDIYMNMCVCMYIYMFVRVYIYVCVCMCVYVCVYAHLSQVLPFAGHFTLLCNICICMYINVQVDIYAHKHTFRTQHYIMWLPAQFGSLDCRFHKSINYTDKTQNNVAMRWLWSVWSIKSQVSFAKEPYKQDDILQKRPVISSILLTVATSYLHSLGFRLQV